MDACCQDKAGELEQLRERQSKVLWVVLGINAVMFVFELVSGILAGSVALLADSLDMLGDTIVYGFSLAVLTRSARWKASAALLKGVIMALFGLGVLAQTGYKLLFGGAPDAQLMGVAGAVVLAANATCLYLLTRHRNDDLNMRSTWLCSRNDIIANTGVLLAAGSVYLTTSKWPDVIISFIITIVFLKSAWYVIHGAVNELRTQQKAVQPIQLVSVFPQQRCTAGTCLLTACTCPVG
jgi:cation diffusion facilitator family transporter